MNIAEAKQQVKDTVEAYLAKDAAGFSRIPAARQRPLFLVGAPGIGKTTIMEQVAAELGIGLVSYSMTHHTRQSALGLPFIVHREWGGGSFEVSEYTMSEIIASVHDYMDRTGLSRGILFLDEINCVSETLYPSMLQFLQFKTFGRHKVPDDWVIVCAGNPPEYNRSVHEFDIVTLDRLRKIEVEPDYAAWRAYALESGVHPAVTSFLEVRPECFYSVESTPSGKRFVTARGWDDLSDTIALFEDLGKPVDRRLVSQFLQDGEIAEKFATYYDLFNKYRSDYQVGAILAGSAPKEIAARAEAAAFDERLALLSLLLDALSASLGEAVEAEEALSRVRDVLREAKPELLSGAALADAVEARIGALEQDRARRASAGASNVGAERREKIATDTLKDLCLQAKLSRAVAGPAAFEELNRAYRALVEKLEAQVDAADSQLANAFGFLDRVFGDGREMAVFATELTARRATSRFINRFGSESYFEHNDAVKTGSRRKTLAERIAKLGVDGKAAVPASSETAGETAAAPASAPGGGEGISAYYENASFEFGFSSMCKMVLPTADLSGKTVLDVGCRRGKGVFKLSERVGAKGRAIGIDWTPGFIDEARARSERAWRDSGLSESNMDFLVGFPEDLRSAGVGDGSVDVVFANSSLNLAFDREAAYRELFRVLRPGGLLIDNCVVADGSRDTSVVAQARRLGNSVQAAPSREGYESLLSRIGFIDDPMLGAAYAGQDLPGAPGPGKGASAFTYRDLHQVDPASGYKPEYAAAAVPADEPVAFFSGCVFARKPGDGVA